MNLHDNQIIYNGYKLLDRKLLSYARSLGTSFTVSDISKDSLTAGQIAHLCTRMGSQPRQLLDWHVAAHKGMKQDIEQLYNEELIKMMTRSQDLIQTPIIIKNDRCNTFSDVSDTNQIREILLKE